MSIAGFSVRQSVLMNLFFFVGILAGLFVALDLNVDVFPNVSFAQATIRTDWLGASARDVEEFVTRRLEEELDEVQGVDRIVSQPQRDFSLIDVKFREDISDAEFDRYFNDLRAAIERVSELPEDAEEPILQKRTVNQIYPIIQVLVSGDSQPTDEAAEVVRPCITCAPVFSRTPKKYIVTAAKSSCK